MTDVVRRPGGGAMRRDTARKFTAAKRELFLHHLADTANVAASARVAGVSSSVVYKRKANDPVFADSWVRSMRFGFDLLEAELLDGALHGYEQPIVWQGQHTGEVRRRDPKMMLALLNAHRAEVRGHMVTAVPDPEVARAALEARLDEVAERLAAPLPHGLVPWERAASDGLEGGEVRDGDEGE